MKYIYAIIFALSLWLCYEIGERRERAYWADVAGCPCDSCIEAVMQEVGK